jgi:uncharacterized protein (DUF305 family)
MRWTDRIETASILAVILAGAWGCTASAPAAGPADSEASESPVPSRPRTPGEVAVPAPQDVDAGVRFMRDMIVHHEQALVMAALVADRTEREDLRLLARRIAVSQEDEIGMMRRWLTTRGEPGQDGVVHEGGGAHAGAHAPMPGMASAEELARLGAVTGEAFDVQFLELMIRHHEGALVMVNDLLTTEGAGQEPELFRFASHVDADQRAEIARMRRVLEALR